MHAGVQSFIDWVGKNPNFPGLKVNPAASVADFAVIEDEIASPLPDDLRNLLRRCNGGTFPTGQLLRAGRSGDDSIGGALNDLATRLGMSPRDPELLLPFFRSDDGGLLAFDRASGPVSDTWCIVDYYLDSGDLRLVYRTLDGWCKASVSEWSAEDFQAPFSLDKYLKAGQRHAQVEPDVSVAHATVAHALRRAGKPSAALQNYLRAARCVPSQAWCDWEALRLSAYSLNVRAGLEAAVRLCARAPAERWAQRDTTPAAVADVLGLLSKHIPRKEGLLRLLDQLAEQAPDDDERGHVTAVRRAIHDRKPLPPTRAPRPTAVPPQPDLAAFRAAIEQAYREGRVRDDELLLDPAYRVLGDPSALAPVLSIARSF
jgi:hypothetical protein